MFKNSSWYDSKIGQEKSYCPLGPKNSEALKLNISFFIEITENIMKTLNQFVSI